MNVNVKEHMLVIAIHDRAYPVRKVPSLLPFIHNIKNLEPVSVCLFHNLTLEAIRSESAETIGQIVKDMIAKVDVEKEKIEKQYQ